MEKNGKIIFFYPSSVIGGAQLLFARLAEALIKKEYHVLILDFDEGFIYKYLIERNYQFSHAVISEPNKYQADPNDLFVLSLSYVFYFKNYIHPQHHSRFIFWDLHPFALLESTAFSKLYKTSNIHFLNKLGKKLECDYLKRVKKFFNAGNENNGLYFMCIRNFITNKEFFSLDITPKFLPIPINTGIKLPSTLHVNHDKTNNEPIDIGWISRLEPGKIEILELLLRDIMEYNRKHERKVKIHIIGDGAKRKMILPYQDKMKEHLIMAGRLQDEHLTKYLQQIDIGFSMGTSALEFASRRIATVLVPNMTLRKFFLNKAFKYLWLHNSHGFDVAVEDFHVHELIKTFPLIISEYLSCKTENANKSYEHVLANHSIKSVFEKFENAIQNSTFSYEKIVSSRIYEHRPAQKFYFYLKNRIKRI